MIAGAFNALGITQVEFAQRLGVDPATVNKWLNGSQLPNPKIVPLLAGILAVDVRDLDLAIVDDQRADNKQLRAENRKLRQEYQELIATIENQSFRFEAVLRQMERLVQRDG